MRIEYKILHLEEYVSTKGLHKVKRQYWVITRHIYRKTLWGERFEQSLLIEDGGSPHPYFYNGDHLDGKLPLNAALKFLKESEAVEYVQWLRANTGNLMRANIAVLKETTYVEEEKYCNDD